MLLHCAALAVAVERPSLPEASALPALIPPAVNGDTLGEVPIPAASLRGVRRVTLSAGESRDITFVINRDDLTLVDVAGHRVPVPGSWTVYVGACSPGERGVELGAPLGAQATFDAQHLV